MMPDRISARASINAWTLQPLALAATSHLLGRLVSGLPGFERSRIAERIAETNSLEGGERWGALLRDGLLTGFLEEVFFRGLVFELLRRRWGPGTAISGSAFLFALAHFDAHQALVAGLLGLQLGALRQVHGLGPAILAHVVNNLLAFGLLAHMSSVSPLHTLLAVVVAGLGCLSLARDLRNGRKPMSAYPATLQASARSDE